MKNWLLFFLAIGLVVACTDDDEVSFALQEISAPSNLNAIFDIAQDESGEVSITPTGDGASLFRLFFGDVEGETATEIAPGETVTHVYGEGEYILRIVGVGATGLTSELSRVVTISFSAPSDLVVESVISTSNPFEVTITPSAENATVYDIFFGDVENEEATTIMNGESATHIYAEVGEYTVRVVARGAGAATAESTQIVTILGATDPVELPITFESQTVNYVFGGFEGADTALEANPNAGGINNSTTVLRTTKTEGAQFFAGSAITVNTPIDFSASPILEMKSYSPKANIPVKLRIENEDNSVGFEVDVNTTVSNEWEVLSFDFSAFDVSSTQFVRIVVFYEFVPDLPGDGSTYYFDDIQNAAPIDNGGGQVSGNVDDSAATQVSLPVGFESASLTYTFVGFEGADSSVEVNPLTNGINPTGNALRSIKTEGAQFFGGTFLDLESSIDFSNTQSISLKTLSPKANIPVRMALENSAGGVDQIFVDVNTTTADVWEELVFDFSEVFNSASQYNRVVVFFEFVPDLAGDGSTYYYDDLQLLGTNIGGGDNTAPNVDDSGATQVAFPVGFESTSLTYSFVGFEGADSAIEPNPLVAGINPTSTSMRSTKTAGSQFFAGTFLDLDAAIDFTSTQSISMKVISPKTGIPVRMALENANGGVDQIVVDVNTTTENEWEELVFDFSGVFNDGASYTRMVVFFEFVPDLPGDGSTYYYDDIQLKN
ncbi:MAG: PKD domain-containing protein [Maribacter sp.]